MLIRELEDLLVAVNDSSNERHVINCFGGDVLIKEFVIRNLSKFENLILSSNIIQAHSAMAEIVFLVLYRNRGTVKFEEFISRNYLGVLSFHNIQHQIQGSNYTINSYLEAAEAGKAINDMVLDTIINDEKIFNWFTKVSSRQDLSYTNIISLMHLITSGSMKSPGLVSSIEVTDEGDVIVNFNKELK